MTKETFTIHVPAGATESLMFVAAEASDLLGARVYNFTYEVYNPPGTVTVTVARRQTNSFVHVQDPPAFTANVAPGGVLETFDTALWAGQRIDFTNTHATDPVTLTVTRVCVPLN